MSQNGFPVMRAGIMFEMSGATGTRSGFPFAMAVIIRSRGLMRLARFMRSALHTSRSASAAGFGFPSKSMIEVFTAQGKQSCPHQRMAPPQRGKRSLHAFTAIASVSAWRALAPRHVLLQVAGRPAAVLRGEPRILGPPGQGEAVQGVARLDGHDGELARVAPDQLGGAAPGEPISE